MTKANKWICAALGVVSLAGLAAAGNSAAIAAKAANLTTDQQAAVQQISTYFSQLRDIRGEFTQISPKGKVSTGLFFISKPGKLRFEYAKPNPFIIVSDGTWLTVKNRAKNKADQYPLSATPLNLVLSEQVDLLQHAIIKSVQKNDDIATITLEDKKKLVPGHLVLVYDTGRSEIQQWVVVDGQGRRTTISLSNIEAGVAADPKLFSIKLPNTRKSKRDE